MILLSSSGSTFTVYSYFDHTKDKPLVIQIGTLRLANADEEVKRLGYNLMKLSVSSGVKLVAINTDLIERIAVTQGLYPKDSEYRYTSGEVYETPVLRDFEMVWNYAYLDPKFKRARWNKLFYEYPSVALRKQREYIPDRKEEELKWIQRSLSSLKTQV